MEYKTIEAKIPKKLYENIEERIKLGLYDSVDDVVSDALKKMSAEQSRNFLRRLAKLAMISEKDMLRELEKVRG
ncbi:MAG: hypothetical protein JW778_05400 [Candidatus Altiarchaeota archaeon]|nr:hypothetical protein [Candidatus Altiarchaeota archaeon]